jgi:hypothetical protein
MYFIFKRPPTGDPGTAVRKERTDYRSTLGETLGTYGASQFVCVEKTVFAFFEDGWAN